MSLRSEVVRIFNELIGNSKKITELPAATTPLDGTELIEVVQGGINKKVSQSDVGGGGGGGSVSSVFGRTGAVIAVSGDYTKGDVGLGNVDNISDANKPVSTAQATADGLRVLKAGDTMSGNLAMGSNKVTGLAAASGNGEAVRYEQITGLAPLASPTFTGSGKTTPVDADEVLIRDSAASNILKLLTWANVKATLKTYFDTLYPAIAGSKVIQLAASDETTALTAGTGKITFRMPYAMTLTAVRASLVTAQTSGSIFTVDINEAGTTILSTKLTIDNTEKTSTTAATAAVISDTALADDAEITIDIDQIGDGTGKGLKITLIGS